MTGVAQPAAVTIAAREADARITSAIKVLTAAGRLDEARERFAELVTRHQRRASRIALHYVRDAADADEAVQEAFFRAFLHFDSFREELPFEVWFTRILINGCLDRIKAKGRRERWLVSRPSGEGGTREQPGEFAASGHPSPEDLLLRKERRRQIVSALARLPERQRLVFALSLIDGRSSREVGEMTGLNESTVRVHLFRAVRKLRRLLGGPAPAGVHPGDRR
jgi:RNA polymerase sigma-70 factor, ECF subfamily